MRTAPRRGAPSAGVPILALCLVLPAPALAQVLSLSPNCGVAGTTTINIGGSGWAEPSPPCEYIFFFNGVEIATRQPDGLFGPPASSFVIPGGTPVGCHVVKVELRITKTQQLIQCRQDTIRVIAAEANPWTVQLAADSAWIRLTFDPTNVCDFGDCDSLYFIQTRQLSGTRNNGSMRRVTYVEQGVWANADSIDNDFTAAGISIDRIWGRGVPYYGQPPGASQVGFNGKRPQAAIMFDRPRRPDAAYPMAADTIVTLTLSFEVNVFCAAGDERGKYLGGLTWQWMRDKGAGVTTGKITNTAGTRNQPSMQFTDALSRWNTNHNFNLPTTGPPTTGGVPCP